MKHVIISVQFVKSQSVIQYEYESCKP